MAMYGYLWLCKAMYSYVGRSTFRAILGCLWLCRALYGSVPLSKSM